MNESGGSLGKKAWRSIHEPPALAVRVLVALLASLLAAWILLDAYAASPKFTADFGQWHLAARTVLSGENPYITNGPGLKHYWPWPFTYPAPVVFLVLPFAWLPEAYAAMVFSALSTFVMVLAITRKSLHLLPLLISVPFVMSARLAQWSLLLTAAVFYHWLSFLLVVKPQAAVPVVMAARDRRALGLGAAMGAALLLASFVVMPDWPREWLAILSRPDQNAKYLSPLTGFGGFLLPFVLLKWRRRESWLLLGMAVLPQSQTFYFLLPLLTIPRNFAESLGLVLVSTLGIYLGALFMPTGMSLADFYRWSIDVALLSTFFPCVVLILLRRNESEASQTVTVTTPARDRFCRRRGASIRGTGAA